MPVTGVLCARAKYSTEWRGVNARTPVTISFLATSGQMSYTHVGIASTLMALSPIMVIPLPHLFFQERVSPRSVAGTIIALAGVAIIFLI
jgi:drug/metabolite transporter (DMT)-like permease